MNTVNPEFVERMNVELERNRHKGDWSKWKPTPDLMLSELRHHFAKLEKAIKAGVPEQVQEHAADMANYSAKAFECFGGRLPAQKLVKQLMRRVRSRQSARRRRSKAAVARSWNHIKPE